MATRPLAPHLPPHRGVLGTVLVLLLLATFGTSASVSAASGPFTISGRVLNYAAAPLPGITVQFCTAPSTCARTTTAADGTFVSPPLATARYRVRVTDLGQIYAAGYATTGNTTDRWSRALVVKLTANRSGMTANMLPGTAIQGVITGPNGGPVANAAVAACGAQDEICGRGRSNAMGHYRVVVGEGRFTVRVTAKVSSEAFDGYIGSFGLTFSRVRAVELLGQPGMVHGASVQLTRAPRLSFVMGSQVSSAGDSANVKTRIAWAATASGGTSYTLRERQDLGATRRIATIAGSTFRGALIRPLTLGHAYRFDVRATTERTTGAMHAGPVSDLLLVQDTSAQVTYNGTWNAVSSADRSSGRAMTSGSMGASAVFTFTGRSVAWVTRTGPTAGAAQVFVDGQFAGTFDLSASAAAVRTIAFSRSWPAAGAHTVEISESAIGTHPPVEVDAFLVLD